MPSGIHEIELDVSRSDIWDFISKIHKWAPLVPGYIEHEMINDRQSTWTIKGDFGIVQKTVKLQVDITEWNEPDCVTFNLSGLNEDIIGNGYFKIKYNSNIKTKMIGHLNLSAKGVVGALINAILNDFVPQMVTELTVAIGNKIEEIYT